MFSCRKQVLSALSDYEQKLFSYLAKTLRPVFQNYISRVQRNFLSNGIFSKTNGKWYFFGVRSDKLWSCWRKNFGNSVRTKIYVTWRKFCEKVSFCAKKNTSVPIFGLWEQTFSEYWWKVLRQYRQNCILRVQRKIWRTSNFLWSFSLTYRFPLSRERFPIPWLNFASEFSKLHSENPTRNFVAKNFLKKCVVLEFFQTLNIVELSQKLFDRVFETAFSGLSRTLSTERLFSRKF